MLKVIRLTELNSHICEHDDCVEHNGQEIECTDHDVKNIKADELPRSDHNQGDHGKQLDSHEGEGVSDTVLDHNQDDGQSNPLEHEHRPV